jgi:hypothetical protein
MIIKVALLYKKFADEAMGYIFSICPPPSDFGAQPSRLKIKN